MTFRGLRTVTAVIIALVTLLASGCQSDSGPDPAPTAAPQPAKPDTRIAVVPADGTAAARPDRGVTVSATGGTLVDVTVSTGGKAVEGSYSADRTTWRSTWTLAPGAQYTVSARATNTAGTPVTVTSAFRTQQPSQTIAASLDWVLAANEGKTYGVGLPIVLHFSREVYNQAEVERALEVIAEKPVEGSWYWMDRRRVVYRTKRYWPAHQTVRLIAHMTGVRAAKEVYGTEDLTWTFKIGADQRSVADARTHTMVVRRDGRKVRTMKVSLGNGTTREYTTAAGVHLTMEKGNPTRMRAPGRKKGDNGWYDRQVGWAVRISSRGEYVHAAPWSIRSQGRANVSHGCVNAHPTDAKWFYEMSQPGDIVDVKGTDRPLAQEWENGWMYWEKPWSEWLKGSALNA
ncbi:L,D-transpeptidase [Rhizohabitans arisaemae]|uniref:L,D-transpeptidase n=1 Tax=Rhizohabitans arisaemae TaxID=2720610 RepID=UPI0024B12CD7|nr:Ig-like domain-containing protein [Rhizohabitans arisaemae]